MIKKKLSIIVPVYNEEECISLFFERINKVINSIINNYEVNLIFLNNCSTDNSLKKIQELRSDQFKIKYITYSKNVGYQASLYGGLENNKSDLYFIVDVDMEDPPEMLIDFLKKYEEGYKIVYGKRVDRHENFFIKFLRKTYYRTMHLIADNYFIVDCAEFSLFDNQVKQIVLKNNNNSPFIRAEIGFAGFKRYGFEYKRNIRAAGKPKYLIWGDPIFLISSIVSSTSFPLRLITYLNIIIFVYYFLAFFLISALPTSFNFLILVLMLEFGILSVYLARIYKNQISRSIYIIDYENSNIDSILN